MATIIQIAYEETQEAVARVRELLDETALRDPNWNGTQFEIERDDFTCIPGRDDVAAAVLFGKVQLALRNEL